MPFLWCSYLIRILAGNGTAMITVGSDALLLYTFPRSTAYVIVSLSITDTSIHAFPTFLDLVLCMCNGYYCKLQIISRILATLLVGIGISRPNAPFPNSSVPSSGGRCD